MDLYITKPVARYINKKHICAFMIKNLKPRLYQETIFKSCSKKNCLVVLPTGMGKTLIAILLAEERLKKYPDLKVVFLAPTRPLVHQHIETFKKHLEFDEKEMAVFTGFIKPEKRAELWKKARLIFSTPQGLENDIVEGIIKLDDVSLLVLDEAHRSVGEYAYVFVAKYYVKNAKNPRILGLTASPGSDFNKIYEVCQNLNIEELEVRTKHDPDVKPYIQELEIDWVKLDLPKEFVDIRKLLEVYYKKKLKELRNRGLIHTDNIRYVSKKNLLILQARLRKSIDTGNKNFHVLRGISLCAGAIKVQHAVELLETQGIASVYNYMNNIFEQSKTSTVKAVKQIVNDIGFNEAFVKIKKLYEKGVEHPKIAELNRIVKEEVRKNKDVKIIIFTQYRDSASKVHKELKDINSKIFVGQLKKGGTGLSQKEQVAILNEFREGKFNCLVSTAVGEEGLDIPAVDLVIFYEPIPSAIRSIQRRGRTARLVKGKLIVLMTKATRDEAYHWVAYHKERKMHGILKSLKGRLEKKRNKTLGDFT